MRTIFSQALLCLALCCACLLAFAPSRGLGAEAKKGHEAAAAEHAEEHPEGAPLDFKADLAVWSAVAFVIFILLLARFAWKPLIKGLDLREARIREDIAQAETNRQKAEQMLADHASKLAKVQDEVREILAGARRDAEHVKQQIVSDAQKEAEAAKQRAVSEIGRARDAALKDLFDVMATQVAHATEHVLGRSLKGADQDRLIEEALAEFPRR